MMGCMVLVGVEKSEFSINNAIDKGGLRAQVAGHSRVQASLRQAVRDFWRLGSRRTFLPSFFYAKTWQF